VEETIGVEVVAQDEENRGVEGGSWGQVVTAGDKSNDRWDDERQWAARVVRRVYANEKIVLVKA
jgi:hypothetical protein